MNIWISDNFLKWYSYVETSTTQSEHIANEAYDILHHVENVLENHSSEQFRIDAVVALKRAINQRLKCLSKFYEIEKIASVKPSKGVLQDLTLLGIIRPIMLRKLMEIRNNLEHNNTKPPNKDKCAELLEFVWYFLRTTDRLVRKIDSSILFQNNDVYDSKYWISLETGPSKEWEIKIRGWLSQKMIRKKEFSDSLNIELKKYESGREWHRRMLKDESSLIRKMATSRKQNPTDHYIEGIIISDNERKLKIYKKYFAY